MSLVSFVYVIVVIYCVSFYFCIFFFKQKTAYEMRISDWSSDVCSSDLFRDRFILVRMQHAQALAGEPDRAAARCGDDAALADHGRLAIVSPTAVGGRIVAQELPRIAGVGVVVEQAGVRACDGGAADRGQRSEEQTSELQSHMRKAYASFCL